MTPSAGGLATALRAYFESNHQSEFQSLHWIGVADVSKNVFERAVTVPFVEKDNVVMHPVFLSPKTKDRFYDGFCNSVLWPLFLYFPSFVAYKSEFFEEYIRVNELLCHKILEVYEPGDTIWIHDYHWMLLPEMIREKFADARIGFFLHIPFPSFELVRILPKSWRQSILKGLTGADVVGFQTPDFAQHFVDSMKHVFPSSTFSNDTLTLGTRQCLVKDFPISIDFEKFNSVAKSWKTKANVRRIRRRLTAQKLILSVDRLDYTKAVFNRLESFDLLLEQNPELREKVSYLLLMVPSRESILKYRENKHNVEALISHINGLYGTIGWTPIIYMYKSVDLNKLVSLYAASDIALVVSARDGMNLVAKEYIAARPESDGVLILSETAGAASELTEALFVNPNDRQEIADSIRDGLAMSRSEQKQRVTRMQERVKHHNVAVWAHNFLTTIDLVSESIKLEI